MPPILSAHTSSSNSSPSSSGMQRPSSSSARPGDVATLIIPDYWLPEIMQCLNDKDLRDSARNEIIRCLVDLLFSISHKPTTSMCDEMARKLISKYPFVNFIHGC